MACIRFKAPNGEVSKLYRSLIQPFNEEDAEKIWFLTRSHVFKAWFGDWEAVGERQILREQIEEASGAKNTKAKAYLAVSEAFSADVAALFRRNQFAGKMWHTVDVSGLRHIKNRHGVEKVEKEQGQEVVTDDDIMALPYVLGHYDSIEKGNSVHGERRIVIKKQINGTLIVVEAVSEKGERFLLKTMRKKKRASLPDEGSPSSTAKPSEGVTSSLIEYTEWLSKVNTVGLLDENGEPLFADGGFIRADGTKFILSERSALSDKRIKQGPNVEGLTEKLLELIEKDKTETYQRNRDSFGYFKINSKEEGTIYLSQLLDGSNTKKAVTLVHELFHAFIADDKAFSATERQTLLDLMQKNSRATTLHEAEEYFAEAIGIKHIAILGKAKEAFGRFKKWLSDLLRALKDFLGKNGIDQAVLDDVYGEFKEWLDNGESASFQLTTLLKKPERGNLSEKELLNKGSHGKQEYVARTSKSEELHEEIMKSKPSLYDSFSENPYVRNEVKVWLKAIQEAKKERRFDLPEIAENVAVEDYLNNVIKAIKEQTIEKGIDLKDEATLKERLAKKRNDVSVLKRRLLESDSHIWEDVELTHELTKVMTEYAQLKGKRTPEGVKKDVLGMVEHAFGKEAVSREQLREQAIKQSIDAYLTRPISKKRRAEIEEGLRLGASTTFRAFLNTVHMDNMTYKSNVVTTKRAESIWLVFKDAVINDDFNIDYGLAKSLQGTSEGSYLINKFMKEIAPLMVDASDRDIKRIIANLKIIGYKAGQALQAFTITPVDELVNPEDHQSNLLFETFPVFEQGFARHFMEDLFLSNDLREGLLEGEREETIKTLTGAIDELLEKEESLTKKDIEDLDVLRGLEEKILSESAFEPTEVPVSQQAVEALLEQLYDETETYIKYSERERSVNATVISELVGIYANASSQPRLEMIARQIKRAISAKYGTGVLTNDLNLMIQDAFIRIMKGNGGEKTVIEEANEIIEGNPKIKKVRTVKPRNTPFFISDAQELLRRIKRTVIDRFEGGDYEVYLAEQLGSELIDFLSNLKTKLYDLIQSGESTPEQIDYFEMLIKKTDGLFREPEKVLRDSERLTILDDEVYEQVIKQLKRDKISPENHVFHSASVKFHDIETLYNYVAGYIRKHYKHGTSYDVFKTERLTEFLPLINDAQEKLEALLKKEGLSAKDQRYLSHLLKKLAHLTQAPNLKNGLKAIKERKEIAELHLEELNRRRLEALNEGKKELADFISSSMNAYNDAHFEGMWYPKHGVLDDKKTNVDDVEVKQERFVEKLSEMATKASVLLRTKRTGLKLMRDMSYRLGLIDPQLRYRLERMEYNIIERIGTHEKHLEPFYAALQKLTEGQQFKARLYMINQDFGGLQRFLSSNGIDINPLIDVLNQIQEDYAKHPYLRHKLSQQYLPVSVNTSDGFLEEFGVNDFFEPLFEKRREQFGSPLLNEDQRRNVIVEMLMLEGQEGNSLRSTVVSSLSKEKVKGKSLETPVKAIRHYIDMTSSELEKASFFKGDNYKTFISGLVKTNVIRGAYEDELSTLLETYFNTGRISENGRKFISTVYGLTLGQVTTMLRQIEDLATVGTETHISAFAKRLYKRKIAPYVDGEGKSQETIIMKDMFIESVMEELSDTGKIAKTVMAGLRYADRKMKNVFFDAYFDSLREQAKRGDYEQFKAFMDDLVDDATTELIYKDIKANKLSSDVKYSLFAKLKRFQPIAKSDTTEVYQRGKMFVKLAYQLQSFALKRMAYTQESIVRPIVKGVSENDGKLAVKGIKRLGRFFAMQMVFGTVANGAIGYLLPKGWDGDGDEDDIGSFVMMNLLAMMALSKYDVEQIERSGLFSYVNDRLYRKIPVGRVGQDFYKAATSGDFEYIYRYTPYIGAFLHYYGGKGKDRAAKNAKRIEKRERIKKALGVEAYQRLQEAKRKSREK